MYTGNDLHRGPPERPDARQGRATSDKGVKVALLFVFFHKRPCGPLANSLFHHRPHSKARPKVPLEAAYHKADDAIQEIIHLLKAT